MIDEYFTTMMIVLSVDPQLMSGEYQSVINHAYNLDSTLIYYRK